MVIHNYMPFYDKALFLISRLTEVEGASLLFGKGPGSLKSSKFAQGLQCLDGASTAPRWNGYGKLLVVFYKLSVSQNSKLLHGGRLGMLRVGTLVLWAQVMRSKHPLASH